MKPTFFRITFTDWRIFANSDENIPNITNGRTFNFHFRSTSFDSSHSLTARFKHRYRAYENFPPSESVGRPNGEFRRGLLVDVTWSSNDSLFLFTIFFFRMSPRIDDVIKNYRMSRRRRQTDLEDTLEICNKYRNSRHDRERERTDESVPDEDSSSRKGCDVRNPSDTVFDTPKKASKPVRLVRLQV